MSEESTAPAAAPVETPAIIDTAQALEAVVAAAQDAPAAPVEQPKAEEKRDDKFAAKFAALSKKEKQLRTQEKQLVQMKKDMEAWKAQQEETLKPYMSLKERAAKDPSALIEELKAVGLDEKQLVEKYIFKQEPTAEEKQQNIFQKLQGEIEALKAERQQEREQAQQKEADSRKKAEQSAKENYLKHLGDFVGKNSEKYELIQKNDAVDLVYEVMEEHYHLTEKENGKGELLTEQEAADKVEDYLFEQAKKIIESPKLKALVSRSAPEAKPKGQSATLSNSAAQTVSSTSARHMSDAESKKHIASMIKFTS